MTLREQVEALQPLDIGGVDDRGSVEDEWVEHLVLDRAAVLDLIDAHRCALTDEVLGIIRENGDARVNAALDKVAAEVGALGKGPNPTRSRLIDPDDILAAIEAARPKP